MTFSLSDYDYDLPKERIAQRPAARRDLSRLLGLRRQSREISHHRFSDLAGLLKPDDVLVVNNTRVIPARLMGNKETGGRAEVLIIDYAGAVYQNPARTAVECECLIRASKSPRPGTRIIFGPDLRAVVTKARERTFQVAFTGRRPFDEILAGIGRVPLPPYIRRDDPDTAGIDDDAAYQTIYADQDGAVAAPTAGLHFSETLMAALKKKGIQVLALTLHVGYGTFMPVQSDDIRDHRIHCEYYSISEDVSHRINAARSEGRRIVAVGTTSVRALEYAAQPDGTVAAGKGACDLFIYPGYRFKVVEAMITNFHLPRSTLLMLVSAFAGRELILSAYRRAIDEHYRFYSYGDAMLIE